MGRIGEVVIRTWQTAHVMKAPPRRRCPATAPPTTCGPAATSPSTRSARRSPTASTREVGSVEVGKLADLVLWDPAFFGVRPHLVVKGGMIAWAADGRRQRLDPDAAAGAARGRCSARTAAVAGRDQSSPSWRRPRSTTGSPTGSACAARLVAGRRHPRAAARPTCRRTTPCRDIEVDADTFAVAHRRRARRAGPGRPSCRWPSATSCSDADAVADAALLLLADGRLPGRRPRPLRRARGGRRRRAGARRGRRCEAFLRGRLATDRRWSTPRSPAAGAPRPRRDRRSSTPELDAAHRRRPPLRRGLAPLRAGSCCAPAGAMLAAPALGAAATRRTRRAASAASRSACVAAAAGLDPSEAAAARRAPRGHRRRRSAGGAAARPRPVRGRTRSLAAPRAGLRRDRAPTPPRAPGPRSTTCPRDGRAAARHRSPSTTPPGRCVSLPPDHRHDARRITTTPHPRPTTHRPRPAAAGAPGSALRIGIGGPVGSGKTALVAALCRALARRAATGRRDQRHLHHRGRRLPAARRRAARRADRARWRPAAARTPRSATTSPPTSTPSRTSRTRSARSTWCSSRAAATT